MRNILIVALSIFFLVSCSQESKQIVTEIEGDDIEQQMIKAYNEGVESLEKEMQYMLQKNLMKLNCYIRNLYGHLEQL